MLKNHKSTFSAIIFAVLFLAVCAWPPAAYAEAVGPFEDVTEAVGLAGIGGSAAAWGDYDKDTWADVYTGGTLWRNVEGKKFVKVSGTPLSGGGGLWGDYNNDGFLDLYCWGNGKLFRNVEGREFEDVSDILPKRPMDVSRGAVWGDFDGNGWLDLYVGGYEVWKKQISYPDAILLNQKGKSFTESWRTPQNRLQRARGVTAADFDGDGDMDVYVSNYRLQPNVLWRNDGRGHFEDVAPAFGAAGDKVEGWYGHTIGSA